MDPPDAHRSLAGRWLQAGADCGGMDPKNKRTCIRSMTTLTPTVQNKLEELCRSILAQSDFEAHRLRVDQFMVNDEARSQYVRVSEQGEHLQHKRMQGVDLSPDEVAEFERQRELLLTNPVARGFLDAQEALHDLRESIDRFISRTLELGRLPESEDLQENCGHGCGCKH
jgi:cell fate (sporulation/competence/biofilm development) regulator YlbF (YheA/YmcA/DUF963 family)